MNNNFPRRLFCGLMVSVSALVAAFLPTASFAGESQNLILLRNTELQPGDVINFKSGWGAFLGVGEYGHTAMYLGIDPDRGREKVFLDFTKTKQGRNPKEFRGRISSLEELMKDNIDHKEFDVYRLNVAHSSNQFQKKLLDSAKEIARNKIFGNFIDCANAASRALTDASGLPIIVVRPDRFAEDFRFDPSSLTVNIRDVLAESMEQKEHDARLRGTLGGLAQQSCMSPGSVSQEALNRLPRPYNENFSLGERPYGLGGGCYVPLYQYLAKRSGERPDAETVRRMSAPVIVAQTLPQKVQAVRPVQQPAVLNVRIPFESHFPRLKEFAVTACRSSEQVSPPKDFYESRLPISFSRELDDSVENALSVGLGNCEKQVFHKLIEMIRSGQGKRIDAKWVGDMVAGYRQTQSAPISNAALPPENRGRECFIDANGTRACTAD